MSTCGANAPLELLSGTCMCQYAGLCLDHLPLCPTSAKAAHCIYYIMYIYYIYLGLQMSLCKILVLLRCKLKVQLYWEITAESRALPTLAADPASKAFCSSGHQMLNCSVYETQGKAASFCVVWSARTHPHRRPAAPLCSPSLTCCPTPTQQSWTKLARP